MQTDLDNFLAAQLDDWRADGLDRQFRVIASASGARIRIGDREFLNFSSNDYLGLANDPLLKRAAQNAIEQFGVGATASRLVCGNFSPYAALEEKLARFKNKPAAIVFGSGYAANIGVISALVGEGDIIIADKLCHASIIDGARLSGATLRIYPHKNLERLEELLVGAASPPRRSLQNRSANTAPKILRSNAPQILIITETVFSMDGDLAPLREIVELKEKYGAWLMIDEAHATGLYAPHRRGIAEAVGVEDKIEITLGTLSKSLGAQGGYIVGSQSLIDFLRNKARSLIYSTAMPPAIVAAAAAAVDFVMSDAGHERRDQLWRNVSEMKNGLSALGIKNESRSPIIPIIIGNESAAVEISQELYEQGIFVPAIRYPTVPKGKARLRVTVTAGHTEEEIGKFLSAFNTVYSANRGGDAAPTTDSVGAASSPRQSTTSSVGAASPPRQAHPHSSALRFNRFSIPNKCYLLTTCVADRKPLLATRASAQIVINALIWLRNENRIHLLGFVIMPDHAHAAIALKDDWTLEKVVHSWKSFTAHQLCKAVNLHGNFWQDGYHEHMVRDRADLQTKLDYMYANPVRGGLVNFVDEFPFSTAHPNYRNEVDWDWLQGDSPK